MTNQSDRQASVRATTGTSLTYEGDWHALFDMQSVPLGTFDERMLAWINAQLSSSYTELNGAMNAYAVANGVANWNSLGTFMASSFTPASISGLAAWYDRSTMINSLGFASAWNDKSGNNRNISNATGAQQPAYSSTAGGTLSFDGVDDYLFNALPFMYAAGACTVFAVMKSDGGAVTGGGALIHEANSSLTAPLYSVARHETSNLNDQPYWIARNDANTITINQNTSLGTNVLPYNNTKKIWLAEDTGSIVRFNEGGTQGNAPMAYARSGTVSLDRFAIGASPRPTPVGYMVMEANEYIIYNRILTTAEKNQVGNYLATVSYNGSTHGVSWTNI